ncbi:MAG: GAF domain-containing protein [Verrucomicrobia bacterium]|nr:GAF domain-containing protein [Verrucomicrobiota bacterium]
MAVSVDSIADTVLGELDSVLSESAEWQRAVLAAWRALRAQRPQYHWVGLYLLEGNELRLGPFLGARTEHTRIPVGRGVCGAAVVQGHNINVPDVTTLDNYLSCSPKVRSELVVLIRDPRDERILGQIDIDSHKHAAFTAEDEQLLERIASRLADLPGIRVG